MNLFEIVKYGVSCREAAERYGMEVNHYGMARCPFHNDQHPSLYVADDHYKRIRRRCPLKPTASMLPTGRISWTAALPPTRATATTG